MNGRSTQSMRGSIVSLICGYAPPIRRSVQLAMHVAYVDESGKGDRLFVVGGVTARAEATWLDFIPAWQAILALPPSVEHFHLADTQGLRREDHNAKIPALLQVINRHVERADFLVIHVESYKRIFGGKIGTTYDNPFMQGYVSIFQQIANEGPYRPEDRIDFVYDEMSDTEYLELLHAYRSFKDACPDAQIKARLGSEPIRRKDTEVIPLQAADLLAGLFLRAFKGDAESLEHLRNLTISNRAVEWDEASLKELFLRSANRSPAIAAGLFYEDKRERSKRLSVNRQTLRRDAKS